MNFYQPLEDTGSATASSLHDNLALGLEWEDEDKPEKEKSDLPEKGHYGSLALEQSTTSYEDEGQDEIDLDCVTQNIPDDSANNASENFIRLIENSECVFNGFEELLQGSATLLDNMGKLIRSSRGSQLTLDPGHELDREEQVNKGFEDTCEHNSSDGTSGDLSPLISLTALQKASDLERERIEQLKEQIQAMNASILETDMFIKQCQTIDEELDKECRKLDEYESQVTVVSLGMTAGQQTASKPEPTPNTASPLMMEYQAADATAPTYHRWSMLYNETSGSAVNIARALSLGEGEPNRARYYVEPPYDELESIWESSEEDEEAPGYNN